MQTESIGDDCLELFDANIYGIGQKRNLGLCYLPPTYEELEKEARNTNQKLIPNNKEKFFEIILKEQKVRLEKGVQDLYVKMNQSGMVEELIHAEIFKHFGYDDCPLNHKLYYALTRKYIKDPELKKQVFFWRNNVMHGSKIQLYQEPPEMPLLTLQNQQVRLQTLLQQCHNEKRLLVVFAAMADYIAFAENHQDTCKCIIIYIKEAHFVERDKEGNYVDGWPIGFYEYEYPQHKAQQDRLLMAKLLKEQYQIPDDFEMFQDVYPQNLFDETFGIWPDNMVVFKECKFFWRGIVSLDGSRENYHSQLLETHLNSLKY